MNTQNSSAPAVTTPTILLTNDANPALIAINVSAQVPLKLTSTNYTSWKLQFQTLLVGYDLIGYIDGTKPCPPETLAANQTTQLNPAYTFWIRQDQLILNAIIGSMSPTLIPFIARANTSRQAWTILANTYAQPSCGRIKQVKARADELALLGVPMDDDDLIEKILDGLGSDYKDLVHVVHARDTPITFDELHEKLLTFEAHLQEKKPDQSYLPTSANLAHRTISSSRPSSITTQSPHFGPTNTGWRPSSTNTWRPSPGPHQPRGDRPPPRTYLGYCQICGIQGHTAKRPEPAHMCTREIFMEKSRQARAFTEENLAFQKKILERSGLGQKTYFTEAILSVPPNPCMAEARKEAEMVMFGAIDQLLDKTGVKAKDIGILDVNCSLFNPTPSLSAMIVNHYKLLKGL
ncbi:hypothetical protein F0562_031960 [Nyssa sinensis]|uniref:Retrotransposon Copia-like N-terminal domain-containing protein n=1 Tax=Nyssa sinensis TaxID=561372 RepID=A0A5J5AU81_9ASTE|nr:hypothetical protein F0562_031960 [Nyssa sinensis]